MQEIGPFLVKARKQGIIDTGQAKRLESLWAQSTGVPSEGSGVFGDLSKPVYSDDDATSEPTEAPRLVRGFHDILITIGILVGLGGLWALASAFAVIPAIIVLSEIFVKRQNLALPAFTLTLMLSIAVAVLLGSVMESNENLAGTVVFLGLVSVMAIYYWRYRVPIALASLIWSGFGLVFFALIALGGGSPETLVKANPRLIGFTGLVLTIGMFVVAMRLDLKDPLRVTRRSDVAFWLHLGTAPLLLYSTFIVLFGSQGALWAEQPELSQALAAIAIITAMVMIGILIDRRAFVTSGLISLGAAFAIITRETGFDVSNVTAFALLAVGIIVLLLGTGWQYLRRLVLNAMPNGVRDSLPPVG